MLQNLIDALISRNFALGTDSFGQWTFELSHLNRVVTIKYSGHGKVQWNVTRNHKKKYFLY